MGMKAIVPPEVSKAIGSFAQPTGALRWWDYSTHTLGPCGGTSILQAEWASMDGRYWYDVPARKEGG